MRDINDCVSGQAVVYVNAFVKQVDEAPPLRARRHVRFLSVFYRLCRLYMRIRFHPRAGIVRFRLGHPFGSPEAVNLLNVMFGTIDWRAVGRPAHASLPGRQRRARRDGRTGRCLRPLKGGRGEGNTASWQANRSGCHS